jgi:hypothetical protein
MSIYEAKDNVRPIKRKGEYNLSLAPPEKKGTGVEISDTDYKSAVAAVPEIGVEKSSRLRDVVTRYLRLARGVAGFTGKTSIDFLRYFQNIIPYLPAEIIKIVPGTNVFDPFIHPTISTGWIQSTPEESFARGGSYFINKKTRAIWNPDEGYGNRGDVDYLPSGDTPYRFKLPIKRPLNQPLKLNLFIIGHGELWPIKKISHILESQEPTATVKIEFIVPLGNSNWGNPTKKDVPFFNQSLSSKADISSALRIYNPERAWFEHRNDGDTQMDPARRIYHTITSNIFSIGKRLIFEEPGTDRRDIADNSNYGVYIGENNLGIPPGVKYPTRDLLNLRNEVTIQELSEDIIDFFDLKVGDELNYVDLTCNIVVKRTDTQAEQRLNRLVVGHYEELIKGINSGLSFKQLQILVYKQRIAYEQIINEPLSPRTAIKKFQNFTAESQKAVGTGAGGIGGRLKKRVKTKKQNKKGKTRENRKKRTMKNKRRT